MERSYRLSRPDRPCRIAGRTIAIVGAVAIALGGCSVFMHGPDPRWDGTEKPDCSESYAPVMVDGVTSSSFAAAAIDEVFDETLAVPAAVILVEVGLAVVYAASARDGAGTYRACRAATASWRAREAIRERAGRGTSISASPSSPGTSRPPLDLESAATYYCILSPSRPDLELCLRSLSRCEHVHQLMGLLADEDCVGQGTAWCFGAGGAERCFTNQTVCETHLTRSSDHVNDCGERH